MNEIWETRDEKRDAQRLRKWLRHKGSHRNEPNKFVANWQRTIPKPDQFSFIYKPMNGEGKSDER